MAEKATPRSKTARRRLLPSCLAVGAFLAAVSGPASGCATECKAYASIGLRISVTDAASQPVCDAIVTARTGGYSETMNRMPGGGGETCTYLGAVDRKGTYSVTVEAAGQSKTVTGLHVTGIDDCGHVKQVAVTVPLGGQ